MRNADLAVLGLLMEQPRHGYQIEQVIQERNMRDWTEIGFSSIYAILGRLQKLGYLQASLKAPPGRGPARKVFRVTRSGRAAWKRATLLALSLPSESGLPFLLGLVGLPAIPGPEAIAALKSYRDRMIDRRERVAARKDFAGPNLPLFLEGIFDYGLALAGAEIEWVEGFIERLEADADRPPAAAIP
ncbi:MAG TPA: PadR family transcriptional regulator [Anaerolineales bacterium]